MAKPVTPDTTALQAKDTKTNIEPIDDSPAVIGRPPLSEAIRDKVLERIGAGETLVAICRDKDMPVTTTVHRWIAEDSRFRARYTRARETQQHVWADECVAIADDGTTDYITKVGRNGHEYEAVDQEHIQRSRLRVDTRLRLMAVVAPHIYGQKVDHQHGGEVTVTHDISSLSEREKMRRMALFMVEDTRLPPIDGQASSAAADEDDKSK